MNKYLQTFPIIRSKWENNQVIHTIQILYYDDDDNIHNLYYYNLMPIPTTSKKTDFKMIVRYAPPAVQIKVSPFNYNWVEACETSFMRSLYVFGKVIHSIQLNVHTKSGIFPTTLSTVSAKNDIFPSDN